MDWNLMQSVDKVSEYGSKIKFCSGCEKEVYESRSDEELIENVHLNRCVAINRKKGSRKTSMIKGMMRPPRPLIGDVDIPPDWPKKKK